ncbi:extracellular solute-binding protein [Paenibacillus radicis (ex Xue et al. 2023)]|uniref:Extracellular solute-binding protein n=1 Tax=Paenibacillus radicis (ex Xue et al. 2023) TaxID=2972489 RepID=A0ABT1YDX5_9BACL|nr:extracellular solute-binding protein [Paenibacillus radicis (ex Xue et al. 2023)]MCR8631388.1 extracellular solute-binding protein [Paenibacillus radicis (ex Xue et al. 2023)]
MDLRQKYRVLTAASTALIMTGVVLSGCSGSDPGKNTNVQSAPDKPFSLSLMLPYYATEPPEPNNPTLKTIEEYTGTKLNAIWIPSVNYEDRFNVTLSSNDLPDGIVALNNKAPSVVQSVRSGMFWELGPYLKDFKNLNQINKIVQYNTSYDGKTYSLYRGRVMARSGYIFRKDWLDNLGLKEPKTPDEFYNVLKAFTLNDPDKNGKNDTYGLSEHNALMSLDAFAVTLGAPYGWGEAGGVFTPAFMTKEYLEALKFYKKLFDERLMNSDFAVANKSNLSDNYNKGKAGIFYTSLEDSYTGTRDLIKLNPNAKVDIFSRLEGPKGVRIVPTAGWNGMYFFSKEKLKTEGDLKKALNFFDKLEDQKMQDLLAYGVEGEHYKLEGNVVQIIPEKVEAYVNGPRKYFQLPLNYAENMSPVKTVDLVEKYTKMFKENLPNIVADPSAPLISQTYSEVGNELDKMVLDAKTKYIMGAIDDAGWQKSIEQWRSKGGDKVIAEFGQEFAKIQKK